MGKYEEKLLKCDALLKQFGAFESIDGKEVTVYSNEKNEPQEELDRESEELQETPLSDNNNLYKWTRPGSGIFTKEMLDIAATHGYSTVLGNVYPFDPHIRWPWLNARHVVARVSPGSVIIIHDRPYTCASLDYILQKLAQEKQYQFLTLTQLANYTGSA